uniref:Uncharacterized protein n=1 Tax=Rhizophora mucronata TaxID=61149 RepID=A0A2P2NKZ2_RHIMU
MQTEGSENIEDIFFCERVASKSASNDTAQGTAGRLDSAATDNGNDAELPKDLSWPCCVVDECLKVLFKVMEAS